MTGASISALLAAAWFAADPSPPAVYGGESVEDCDWPSVVSMDQNAICTGTLIHPEIVIYAAHCGNAIDFVRIGSTINDPAESLVPVEGCALHPKWSGELGLGSDFAYCKLAEPVTDVPIIPPLMGCELEVLQPETPVWAIGFGFTEDGTYGVKHAVELPIVSIDLEREVLVGEENVSSICNGDSGGPLAIQLPASIDPARSWRMFGVTSWGPADCWQNQYFGLMHNAIPWIERASGIDVTPCHDADGTWRGGPECSDFVLDPRSGTGSWSAGCSYPGPVSGPVTTCGPTADPSDDIAPVVRWVSPTSGLRGTTDADGKFSLDVLGEVTDEGWGVERVQLLLDASPLEGAESSSPPFGWPLNLPAGQYVFHLLATDKAGNETLSEPMLIGVDMDPPAPPPVDVGGDDTTSGGGGATNGGSDEGCACAIREDAPAAPVLAWITLAWVATWSRRRNRRARGVVRA